MVKYGYKTKYTIWKVKGMAKKTIGTYKSIEKNKIPDNIDSTNDIAVLESNLDIILNQYKKSLSQIIDDKRYVKIAVAGRMNHGKSSLLNSLIGDDIFNVQDIRETTTNSRYELVEDVLLVDTPGLDANITDDAIANVAYESSNIILFVHNYNVGDFHKGELEALKRIADFHNSEAFSDRFILVLTGKDAVTDQNDRELIKLKLLKDIKEFCGLQNFPIFEVSNTTFMKGKSENKEKLIIYSGIPTLLEYITSKIEELKPLRTKQTIEKIRNIQSIAIHLFNEILQNKTVNLDSELIDADKLYEEYERIITTSFEHLYEQEENLTYHKEEIYLLENSIDPNGFSQKKTSSTKAKVFFTFNDLIDCNKVYKFPRYIYKYYIKPNLTEENFPFKGIMRLYGGNTDPEIIATNYGFIDTRSNLLKNKIEYWTEWLDDTTVNKYILIIKSQLSSERQIVNKLSESIQFYKLDLYDKFSNDFLLKDTVYLLEYNNVKDKKINEILEIVKDKIYGESFKLKNEVEYIKPWIADVDNFSDMTISLLEGLDYS